MHRVSNRRRSSFRSVPRFPFGLFFRLKQSTKLSVDPSLRRRYTLLLAFLAVLFAARVLGQFFVTISDVPWLPPFESWYSGLIPYPILLALQVALILLLVKVLLDFRRGTGFFVELAPRAGLILMRLSYLYAFIMGARYIVTMAMYPERRWFGGTIPIWFHFVLAAFLYVLGRYQVARSLASGEAPPS